MSMLALGLLFGGVTLLVMFSGMPIAFSLGFVAIVFMYFFMPGSSLDLPQASAKTPPAAPMAQAPRSLSVKLGRAAGSEEPQTVVLPIKLPRDGGTAEIVIRIVLERED